MACESLSRTRRVTKEGNPCVQYQGPSGMWTVATGLEGGCIALGKEPIQYREGILKEGQRMHGGST